MSYCAPPLENKRQDKKRRKDLNKQFVTFCCVIVQQLKEMVLVIRTKILRCARLNKSGLRVKGTELLVC